MLTADFRLGSYLSLIPVSGILLGVKMFMPADPPCTELVPHLGIDDSAKGDGTLSRPFLYHGRSSHAFWTV
jgi:hypothetical protein